MESVKINSVELELQNGTMFRFDNGDPPYYCDIGIMNNGNKVLFYYTDCTEVIDYIDGVIVHLPTFAAGYLEDILINHKNILVRLWYNPGSEASCFEIYYDCNCTSNDILEVINWMANHNDFATANYCYTEVRNGHQEVCK